MGIVTTSDRVSIWLGPSKNLEFEKHTAFTFAVMWNDLDLSVIEPLLADDVCWESQNSFVPIKGKSEVMDHLKGKIETIRKDLPESTAFAELGTCQGRPCVIIALDKKENRLAVVLFSIKENRVSRIDLCTVVPCVEEARWSGEYPTLKGGGNQQN